MKNVGLKMSLMMGAAMSLCLSLVGNLTSGHFRVPAFLVSFAISFAISLLIGLLAPMQKITGAVNRRFRLKPGTLEARCAGALVSDLLYTPVITVAMVTFSYRQAVGHGAQLAYWPMLGRGLLVSLAAGFALAFVLTPVFLKLAMGKRGGK